MRNWFIAVKKWRTNRLYWSRKGAVTNILDHTHPYNTDVALKLAMVAEGEDLREWDITTVQEEMDFLEIQAVIDS